MQFDNDLLGLRLAIDALRRYEKFPEMRVTILILMVEVAILRKFPLVLITKRDKQRETTTHHVNFYGTVRVF